MPILIFQSSMKRQNVKKKKKGKTHYFFFSFSLFACSTSQVRFFLFAYYCFVCFCCDARGILQLLIAKTLERRAERSSESAGETERARERARERVERFVISAPPSIIRVFGLADGQTHAFSLSLFLPFSRLFSSLSSGSRARGGIEKLEGADFGRREGDEGARKGREKQSPPAPSFSLRRRHVRNADSSSSSLLPFPTTSASSSSLLLFPTSSPSSSPSPHTASTWPTRTTTKTTPWTPRR